jgi:putative component of toxin-antitoxin plasmid stabilization module
MEVRRYCSAAGSDEFGSWLAALGDPRARAAVLARVKRRQARDIEVAQNRLSDFQKRSESR